MKSKFRIFRLIFHLFFIGAVILWLSIFLGMGSFKTIAIDSFLIFFFVLLIMLLLIYVNISILKIILISSNNIKVKNLFFINILTCNWNEISYFTEKIEYGKGGSANVIYLVKNKTVILSISDSVYKNYDKIKEEISKKLEQKNINDFNFSDRFRMLFGKKISKLP